MLKKRIRGTFLLKSSSKNRKWNKKGRQGRNEKINEERSGGGSGGGSGRGEGGGQNGRLKGGDPTKRIPNKRKTKRSKKPPPNAGARSPMNMKSRSLDPETSQGAERAQVPIVELSK